MSEGHSESNEEHFASDTEMSEIDSENEAQNHPGVEMTFFRPNTEDHDDTMSEDEDNNDEISEDEPGPYIRKQSRTKRSKRPKLLFPAYLARRFLRNGDFAKRIGKRTPVALAAVIEYLALEMLGLSGMIAVKMGAKRIQPRHILLAIRLDDEMNELLSHITVAHGGVLPNSSK